MKITTIHTLVKFASTILMIALFFNNEPIRFIIIQSSMFILCALWDLYDLLEERLRGTK